MTSGATSAYQAGSEKQLFFDDVLVESARGVRLVLNPPRKTGERCLVSDRPWEDFYAGGWNTVLEDAGTFKMWYGARDVARLRGKYRRHPLGKTGP